MRKKKCTEATSTNQSIDHLHIATSAREESVLFLLQDLFVPETGTDDNGFLSFIVQLAQTERLPRRRNGQFIEFAITSQR